MGIDGALAGGEVPACAVGDAESCAEPELLYEGRDVGLLLGGEPAAAVDGDDPT